MISRLTGAIERLAADRALIDVQGVAYEVEMARADIDALLARQEAGQQVQVITDLIQRDDGPLLFGFADWRGRVAFRALRALPGLGPAKAMDVLDRLGVDALHVAIATGDEKAITRVPGVGPKMARRILAEWPRNLDLGAGDGAAPAPQPAHSARDEAVQGLESLGYRRNEAEEAVDQVTGANPDADARTLLSAALRHVAQTRLVKQPA